MHPGLLHNGNHFPLVSWWLERDLPPIGHLLPHLPPRRQIASQLHRGRSGLRTSLPKNSPVTLEVHAIEKRSGRNNHQFSFAMITPKRRHFCISTGIHSCGRDEIASCHCSCWTWLQSFGVDVASHDACVHPSKN